MVLGTGIDIIEVARIEASYQKFGERFLKRILRPGEIAYCFRYRKPGPFLAARFAAKESISKAFGTGIGAHLSWLDMEVAHRERGQPFVILHDRGQALLAARGARTVHLSLSHTETYAAALAILES